MTTLKDTFTHLICGCLTNFSTLTSHCC